MTGRLTLGADGRELWRFVEAGDRDFPRAERVRTDAEDRKSRLLAVNATRTSVDPIGVLQEVSPRFGSPLGNGVGFLADATLRNQDEAVGCLSNGQERALTCPLPSEWERVLKRPPVPAISELLRSG